MGSLKAIPNISMNNKAAVILCQSQQPSNNKIPEKQNNQIKDVSANNSSTSSSSSSSSSLKSPNNWSDQFHEFVVSFYRIWAKFVIAHPIKIIIFCFLLTIICSIKMIKTKRVNELRGYTPYGARALHEFDVRDEFFGQSGIGIRFFILILPKEENGTMLDEKVLDEAVEVDNIIQKNLTIYNRITNKEESYNQVCRRFCTINDPVSLFAIGWKEQQENLRNGEPLNEKTRLNYPFSKVMDMNVNLQLSFFGVEFGNSRNYTNMEKVEMIVLLYRAERIGGWTNEDISNYEMSVSNYFKNNFTGKYIRVLSISTSYAQVEFDRSGKILITFVSVGLIIMCLASLLSNSLSATFMRQFSFYKFPVALFACLCPLMASGTALGLLFFAGVRNASILGLTPFLILAIGIDDAFLMIHSWQMATSKRRKNNILPAAIISGDVITMEAEKRLKEQQRKQIDSSLAKQLTEVLEETGPAIMISALTNISSDIIGSFTGSPEITLLCVGNIASITVDFFYQITLFTSVLIICARFEFNQEVKNAQQNNKNMIIVENNTPNNNKQQIKNEKSFRNKIEIIFNKLAKIYVKIVSNIWASIFICFVWLTVLLVCIKALTQFEINLTTKKLFPPDSPLLEIENYREEKVLPFYTQAQIFIENPGDLTNKKRRKHLDNLVDEMEHLPNAYPAESSFYFVRAFEAFEKSLSEGNGGEIIDEDNSNLTTTTTISSIPKTQNFDLTDLENFLLWPENTHWKGLINYHTDNLKNESELTTDLDSLMVTVAYHGEELKDWHYRALMLNQWRSVVDKYNEEFNVTVLHDDGLYLDLLENMPTDIWQSAVATLFCMAIICALFMGSNFFVVCVTTGVIASICAETLGILSLTGMSMDPVLMSAVIISIGFSVDIPAHVSYHFHTAKWEDEDNNGNQKTRKTPRSIPERVQRAFSSVGFPALQASACTNACALALLFLPLYIAQVFARVILICITLGTIHSLLLLPALFTIVASVENFYDKYFGENTVKLINGKKQLKKQNSSFRV
ncbi:unnamed protein product [Meloidogyne enterolobii]|uniref:Uncharacterized protein n=1 Tax=Meloidogyne enterolobii TaxID=390850 RepID=A0ACB0ZCA0_MELEN